MEFTIEHREDHFLLTVTGAIDTGAMVEMIRSVLTHDAWAAGTPVLVDESAMDASQATVANVRDITQACSQGSEQFGRSRIAVIVSRDMEFGMNRMWMAFVDGKWSAQCNVFRSKEEAMSWLSA